MLKFTRHQKLINRDVESIRENEVFIFRDKFYIFKNFRYGRNTHSHATINCVSIDTETPVKIRHHKVLSLMAVIGDHTPVEDTNSVNPYDLSEGDLFAIAGRKQPELFRFKEVRNGKVHAKNPLTNQGVRWHADTFKMILLDNLPY